MKIRVQYGKSLVEIARQFGLSDIVDKDLLASSLFSSVEVGEKEVEIGVIKLSGHFDSNKAVEAELRRRGYRSAVMQEFLPFVGVYRSVSFGWVILGVRDERDLPFMVCAPCAYGSQDDGVSKIGVNRVCDLIHDLEVWSFVVVKL